MSKWAVLWMLFLQTDVAVAFVPFALAALVFLTTIAVGIQIELALQPAAE